MRSDPGKKTYTIKYTLTSIKRIGMFTDIYADVIPSGLNTPVGHAFSNVQPFPTSIIPGVFHYEKKLMFERDQQVKSESGLWDIGQKIDRPLYSSINCNL